jgi:hypothetical protein
LANRSLNADLEDSVYSWLREMRNSVGRRKMLKCQNTHQTKKMILL